MSRDDYALTIGARILAKNFIREPAEGQAKPADMLDLEADDEGEAPGTEIDGNHDGCECARLVANSDELASIENVLTRHERTDHPLARHMQDGG